MAMTTHVDVTIPGLSSRDLVRRACYAIQQTYTALTSARASLRRDLALREALGDLDTHLLRDIGVDRSAC